MYTVRLAERKAMGAESVTPTVIGEAELFTSCAASNLAGAPAWFGPAVTAAAKAAIEPILAAQTMGLKNERRSRYNRTALNDPEAPLEMLFRLNPAPHLPPAGNFPATTRDFINLGAVDIGRASKNATIDSLLSFYAVTDPTTNLPFPPTSALAGGAAGGVELQRKHSLLRRFITDM